MVSNKRLAVAFSLLVALTVSGCSPVEKADPTPDFTNVPKVIAVVGDFGVGKKSQRSVADMVAKFSPSYVVTTGDNIYKKKPGYQKWVGDYYPQTVVPATGNHDYEEGIAAFDDYFGKTAFTRTYVYKDEAGVDFFILDSTAGLKSRAVRQEQQAWLIKEVATSTAEFKVVILHHPPFSSAKHGSTKRYQWDFASFGVDLVMSGHDHSYERIVRGGITYVVEGVGGAPLYDCKPKRVFGSQLCDDKHHGAVFLYVNQYQLRAVFRGTSGQTLDTFVINR